MSNNYIIVLHLLNPILLCSAEWIVLNCPAAESVAFSLRTLFALILLYLLLFLCWINPFLYSVHHLPASAFFFLCEIQLAVTHHKNPIFFLIKIFFIIIICITAKVFTDRTFYFLLPICALYFLSSRSLFLIPSHTSPSLCHCFLFSPSQPIFCIPPPNIRQFSSFALVVKSFLNNWQVNLITYFTWIDVLFSLFLFQKKWVSFYMYKD